MSSPYRNQDFQAWAMGSRIFLYVLLLATVTCIVVLQLSLDTWIVQRGLGLAQFTSHDHKKEPTIVTEWIESHSMKIHNFAAPGPVVISQIKSPVVVRQIKSPVVVRQIKSPADSLKNSKSKIISAEIKELNFKNENRAKKSKDMVEAPRRIEDVLREKQTEVRVKPKGDPLKAIQTMPIVDPTKVLRIMLVTYFRSGSSFTGELLQQNWKTFYQFEPLHSMTYNSRILDSKTDEAFDLLSKIYRCNFTNLDNYFNWVKQPKNQFLFARSLFLWFSCRTYPQMCFSPPFVSAVCSRSPFQLTKILRLTMRQVKQFLEENSDLNIKVVYLGRDPRGILSSRLRLDWCANSSCSSPYVLCNEMEDDLKVFNQLKAIYPTRFIRLRYEDLVLDPAKEAAHLFKFLQLPFSTMAQRFLRSHTSARKSETSNPYSTRRNSSSQAYSWRQKLNFEQISSIQEYCSSVIRKMNLPLITSPEELLNDSNPTDGVSLSSISSKNFEILPKIKSSLPGKKTNAQNQVRSLSNKTPNDKLNFSEHKLLSKNYN